MCGSGTDGNTATITAPTHYVLSNVTSAYFGTPNGTCGSYVKGTCDAGNNVTAAVNALCDGKSTCTVSVSAAALGVADPCIATSKWLFVQMGIIRGKEV